MTFPRKILSACWALCVLGCCSPIFAQSSWKELDEKGRAAFERGDYKEAARSFQAATKRAEKEFGDTDDRVATSRLNLAETHMRQGAPEAAEKEFKRAIRDLEKAGDPERVSLARLLAGLAALYMVEMSYPDPRGSSESFSPGAPINPGDPGSRRLPTGTRREPLPTLRKWKADYEKAAALLKRALAIQEKHLSSQHPELAETLYLVAKVEANYARLDKAESLLLRAGAIALNDARVSDSTRVLILTALGDLAWRRKNLQDAEMYYREALALLDRPGGQQEMQLVSVLLPEMQLVSVLLPLNLSTCKANLLGGPEEMRLAVLHRWAGLLRELGRVVESKQATARANDLLRSILERCGVIQPARP